MLTLKCFFEGNNVSLKIIFINIFIYNLFLVKTGITFGLLGTSFGCTNAVL